MARQFHRPARLDPEDAENLQGSQDTAVSSELAHRAAQALVGGFPVETDTSPDATVEAITREGVIAVVTTRGVDEVAELWADSPATTLPGTLWRLFLVRQWFEREPELIERRYATVVDLTAAYADQADGDSASAAEAAGLRERFERALATGRPAPSPEELHAELDTLMSGGLDGSPEVMARLIQRIARFLTALAAGSSPDWIEDDTHPLAHHVTRRDSALLETAAELSESARRAAAGLLD